MQQSKPKIFISYSHAENDWKDYIKGFFKSTQKFDIWDDGEILLGDNWHEKIDIALSEADIGLFLISNNFLNSSYIESNEMPKLINRSEKENIIIINIFIKPFPFKLIDWVAKENESVQGFPTPDKPLSSFIKNHEGICINNHLLDEQLSDLVTLTYFAQEKKKDTIQKRSNKNLNQSTFIEDNSKTCSYDSPQNFYKVMYDFTKSTIDKLSKEYFEVKGEDLSVKILSDNIYDIEHVLPSLLLLKGNLLISEDIDETLDLNPVDDEFVDILEQKCGKKIYDNITFRLSNVKPKNKLVIGESTYYKSLSTCDKHFYNLIDSNDSQMRNEKGENYQNWYKHLKDIVIDENYKTVSGSLACSTLVVFKDFKKDKYQYLIMDNSRKKNGNNSRHVIPSFMFQPPKNDNITDKTFANTLDIKFQMFKEFAEEILGKVQYERLTDGDLLKRAMDGDPMLQELEMLLESKQAEFKVLGLSLDIFRLRPEIMSVLVIENQEFLEKIKDIVIDHSANKIVSEDQGNSSFCCFEVDNISWYDIDNEARYISILTDVHKPIVPPGAACLKLGRDYVLEHYVKR